MTTLSENIFCNKCGEQNTKKNAFCSSCGEKLPRIELSYRSDSAELQSEDEMIYAENQLKKIESSNKLTLLASYIVIPVSIMFAFFVPIALGLLNVVNLFSFIVSIYNYGKAPKDTEGIRKALLLSIVSFLLTLGLFFLALLLTSDPNRLQPIEPLWRQF